MNPLAKQCDELCNVVVDMREAGETSSDDYVTLNELHNSAVIARNSGQTAAIELPEHLAKLVTERTAQRSAEHLRKTGLEKLRDACKAASGIDGAEEYFTTRLVDVGGVPHLADDNGQPVPITPATVRDLLPNSLKTGKRAQRADELEDLRESIAEAEAEVTRLKENYARSGGDTGAMIVADRAMKRLKALKQRRDEIKAERAAERAGPTPLKTPPSPIDIRDYETLVRQENHAAAAYRAAPGNSHLAAKFSAINRKRKALKLKLGI